jgi:SAM-dependent methyltransferase
MLGHNVTGLDIEANYCELVRRRAEREGVEINLINADYLWVETAEQRFDAVIFFESFHHCWEFERLLRGLHRVLAPGGRVYFAAEPINEGFSVPWGVRLDGESLYVARKFGWMELGFHSDFFAELLQRTGWRGVCIHPSFWVAQRADEPMTFAGSDRRLHSQIGEVVGDVLEISAPGSTTARHFGVFGPYVALPRGRYRARITLADEFSFPGKVIMDVCHGGGTVVASRKFTPLDPVLTCEFELAQTFERLEVRLNLVGGSSCSVRELAIESIF